MAVAIEFPREEMPFLGLPASDGRPESPAEVDVLGQFEIFS